MYFLFKVLGVGGGGGGVEYSYKNTDKISTLSDLDHVFNSINEPIAIIILADSTPSGCLQCVSFIEEVLAYQQQQQQQQRNRPPLEFMRVKIPYTSSHFMSSDAFLDPEFDPSSAHILGRFKWLATGTNGDFGSYGLEHIEIDGDDVNVDWPVRYLPKRSHLKANGMYGNRPFISPQLLSGLSYFQQFVLEYHARQQQTRVVYGNNECTIHELACIGVSRFGDLPISVLIEQVMNIAVPGTNGALSVFRPKVATVAEYERFPTHLVTSTQDNEYIRKWLMLRCDRNNFNMSSSPYTTSATSPSSMMMMMIGKTKWVSAGTDMVGLLEEWFQLKIQSILEEKKAKVEAWVDPSSLLFRERQYLRSLFIPNEKTKKFFFSANETMKKELLRAQFPEESEERIDHLLHLPIKRIGPEVFEFLIHDGPSANMGAEGEEDGGSGASDGFTVYSQKTARELLKESLIVLG